MRAVILFLGLALLSSCTALPDFDNWQSNDSKAPYPTLLPMSELLEGGAGTDAVSPEIQGYIENRVGQLRRRAANLRADVIETSARRRMLAGVTP